jgi:hypothetical protein
MARNRLDVAIRGIRPKGMGAALALEDAGILPKMLE